MRVIPSTIAAALASGILVSVAVAQRDTGDPEGVARQTAKPKVVFLSGEVLEVKTEPGKNTTGRSLLGTHLLIKARDGKTINIYLGPAVAVKSVAKKLSRGQDLKAEAFRTRKAKMEQYIARSLTIGEHVMELRDKTFRPTWAGAKAVEKHHAKIAVTAAGPSLDAAVDPRFGRCPYLVIMDVGKGICEAFENSNASARGKAGARTAEMIASERVQVVLTGKCGPSAFRALSAAEVTVVSECSGKIRDVIKQYQEGKLKPASDPNASPRSGEAGRSSATGGRGRRSGP